MINGLEKVFITMDDSGCYSINTIKKTSWGLELETLFEHITSGTEAIGLKNSYIFGKDHGFSEAKELYEAKIVRAIEEDDDFEPICSSCKNELSDKFKYCPYCGGHIENN